MTRRFPPPWTVEEQEAWFAVRDHVKSTVNLRAEAQAEWA